jgi:hypothetical protein
MVALICFVLAVLASPFKSKSRLEAENAVLRHQLIVLQGKGERQSPPYEQRSLVLRSDVSLVSLDPEGRDDYRAGNAGALASGRLSPLLALEIALAGRAPANRDRTTCADPADEHQCVAPLAHRAEILATASNPCASAGHFHRQGDTVVLLTS